MDDLRPTYRPSPSGQVGGSPFEAFPRLAGPERLEVLRCLGALDALDAGAGRGPGRRSHSTWQSRAWRALEEGHDGAARSKDRWLDLVAELLEAADEALGDGRTLEGFALEGVGGRLLGVLTGDGRTEPMTGPGGSLAS